MSVLFKTESKMSCHTDIERGGSQSDQGGYSKCNNSPRSRRQMLSIIPEIIQSHSTGSRILGKRRFRQLLALVPAVSTGRCNTGLESTSWSFKSQSFSRALIEAQGYFVEVCLGVAGHVGFPGEVLS
jgi:hypothetical protein